uniref:Glycosyltransferase n=1 Tax=Kalanchoe fedtschenkoi TaxID=63787 RepID=A0A7N0UFS2_KALFE
MDSAQRKPHAVCVPFPAQGHINPMLKLAKLLHHSGFHITFVHTVYNHRRLVKSNGAASLSGLPGFRFEKIHDGLPETDDADTTQDVPALCRSVLEHFITPFRELVARLSVVGAQGGGDVPPVTCIVSDIIMPFTVVVAEELSVPVVLLLTMSACGFSGSAYHHQLARRCLIPLVDESYLTNGHLDTIIDFIPGMEGIRLRDLYSFYQTTNRDDIMLRFNLEKLKLATKASAIIVNTFTPLESDVLEGLPEYLPKILPVGPLHLLLDRVPKGSPLHSIRSNLWKDESECMAWLGSRPPRSVLYVNYGSVVGVSPRQLAEFAWGLADSGHPFLWVIRPDMAAGEGEGALPGEFLKATEGRSFLASWCPQEQVIRHQSIGGFLTHCGWNSTLEALGAGVPMICWPFFADQRTNCWFACRKWGVGVELGGDVRRAEVGELVREVLGGEKGEDMRRKAAEWKRLAGEAASPSGSSSLNW